MSRELELAMELGEPAEGELRESREAGMSEGRVPFKSRSNSAAPKPSPISHVYLCR